jgi:hypothetical protein
MRMLSAGRNKIPKISKAENKNVKVPSHFVLFDDREDFVENSWCSEKTFRNEAA